MIVKLALRNALRRRIRTACTVAGLATALVALGAFQSIVAYWRGGAESASDTRLVTRNAISLIVPLPLAYEARIRALDGVQSVAYSSWFGGIYRERRNFFVKYAVSARAFLQDHAEYVLADAERNAFLSDRKGCVIGRQLAQRFGLEVGDVLPIQGTIYPGNWEFVIRGIYDARGDNADADQMFFHWEYLNEYLRKTAPHLLNNVDTYIVRIASRERAAQLSEAIDALFRNSHAQTLTETEKAFELGFVAMSDSIITALQAASLAAVIAMAVLTGNSMLMSAGERTTELATLRALGFGRGFTALVIIGESLAIAATATLGALLLTQPATSLLGSELGAGFAATSVPPAITVAQIAIGLAVGLLAGLVPAIGASRRRLHAALVARP